MRKYTKLNIRNRKNPVKKAVKVAKMRLKKGDVVIVVSGKDKGKSGAITRVLPLVRKVLIDNVGVVKRHVGKRGRQSGHIIEAPRPIDVSNVMLKDPKGGKPTRVGRADGARIAKKSGSTLS